MADNKDERSQLADELEKRLKEQEAKLAQTEQDVLADGTVKLEDLEQASLMDPDSRFQIGYRAVSRAELGKDSDGGLSSQIANKYKDLGKSMLNDDASEALDSSVRSQVSRYLGRDPGDVRIHTGEMAQKASEALGARAFALGGSDIYFGRGEYAPDTADGLGTLVHELTHTTDNIAGAAFSSESSDSDRGAAETRARDAESKVHEESESSTEGAGGPSADEEAEDERLDLKKLEDKVADILQRSNKRMSDRTGG